MVREDTAHLFSNPVLCNLLLHITTVFINSYTHIILMATL